MEKFEDGILQGSIKSADIGTEFFDTNLTLEEKGLLGILYLISRNHIRETIHNISILSGVTEEYLKPILQSLQDKNLFKIEPEKPMLEDIKCEDWSEVGQAIFYTGHFKKFKLSDITPYLPKRFLKNFKLVDDIIDELVKLQFLTFSTENDEIYYNATNLINAWF